jgi:hypothetical protein
VATTANDANIIPDYVAADSESAWEAISSVGILKISTTTGKEQLLYKNRRFEPTSITYDGTSVWAVGVLEPFTHSDVTQIVLKINASTGRVTRISTLHNIGPPVSNGTYLWSCSGFSSALLGAPIGEYYSLVKMNIRTGITNTSAIPAADGCGYLLLQGAALWVAASRGRQPILLVSQRDRLAHDYTI